MKVMISQPMAGRPIKEIFKERDRIIDKFEKLHIEVINTVFEDEPGDKDINPGLFYLAKSIDAMSTVDAVYFAKDWNKNRGCRIERQAAREYGVKILDIDFLDEDVYVDSSAVYKAFETRE